MRNDNLIRVIDALGEQIGERDRIIDNQREQMDCLAVDNAELRSVCAKLERNVEAANRQIDMQRHAGKKAIYCADCRNCLSVEDSFQVYCILYGIEFVSSNGCKLIDIEEFSCPKAKAREDAE